MFKTEELTAILMALIPIPKDDFEMKMIRERFMKRDRQWDEVDAEMEYKLKRAKAILKTAGV